MTIHEQIKSDVKTAMKEKDAVRLSAARNLLSAFTNELVSKKRKPDEKLGDEEALAVVRRLSKQRRDSIDQFKRGGREDLVDAEQAELNYLKTYLPAEVGAEEIEKLALVKIKELGASGQSSSGKIVGAVMKDLQGNADGTVVRQIVEKLLG